MFGDGQGWGMVGMSASEDETFGLEDERRATTNEARRRGTDSKQRRVSSRCRCQGPVGIVVISGVNYEGRIVLTFLASRPKLTTLQCFSSPFHPSTPPPPNKGLRSQRISFSAPPPSNLPILRLWYGSNLCSSTDEGGVFEFQSGAPGLRIRIAGGRLPGVRRTRFRKPRRPRRRRNPASMTETGSQHRVGGGVSPTKAKLLELLCRFRRKLEKAEITSVSTGRYRNIRSARIRGEGGDGKPGWANENRKLIQTKKTTRGLNAAPV